MLFSDLPAKTLFALLCGAVAAWAPAPNAGEFAIMPLRVALDRTTRSAEVVVRNDDRVPLRMQVEAMNWRQDAEGKDRYEPADGLVYFPRALEVPPGESRIVRLGVRAAPVNLEETYRLFLEELPPAERDGAQTGATVRVLLRVGVPVFAAPAQPEVRGEITGVEIKEGRARWTVANTGNVHFAADEVIIEAFGRDGARLYSTKVQERYFLAGASRPLQAEIPRDLCPRIAALEVVVAGEKLELRRKIDVDASACR